MTTIIASQLAVDPTLSMDANYKFNSSDRRYIDDQIRAIEQLIVDNLINGKHASWFTLSGSSAAVIAGDTVCLSGIPGSVTKSETTVLSSVHSAIGVVMQAASAGGKVLVALSGVVSPSITALGTGAAGFVRVNATTSRCEVVTFVSAGDYILGTVDAAGWMHIMPSPTLGGTITYSGTGTRFFSIPGTVSTTDTTVTPIASFQMVNETLCGYDIIVTASSLTTATIGGRWKRSAVYNMTGGVSAIVGSQETGIDQETNAGLDVTVTNDGAGLIKVNVIGLAATNINWSVELRVQETSAVL